MHLLDQMYRQTLSLDRQIGIIQRIRVVCSPR